MVSSAALSPLHVKRSFGSERYYLEFRYNVVSFPLMVEGQNKQLWQLNPKTIHSLTSKGLLSI